MSEICDGEMLDVTMESRRDKSYAYETTDATSPRDSDAISAANRSMESDGACDGNMDEEFEGGVTYRVRIDFLSLTEGLERGISYAKTLRKSTDISSYPLSSVDPMRKTRWPSDGEEEVCEMVLGDESGEHDDEKEEGRGERSREMRERSQHAAGERERDSPLCSCVTRYQSTQ